MIYADPRRIDRLHLIINRKLSLVEKSLILEKLLVPGLNQSTVAKAANVLRRTVQNIIKNKKAIKDCIAAGQCTKRCHVISAGVHNDVDNATFEWFTQMREKHGEVPIIENVICQKALKFAQIFNVENFKASRGWFRGWKSRNGLSSYKVCNY